MVRKGKRSFDEIDGEGLDREGGGSAREEERRRREGGGGGRIRPYVDRTVLYKRTVFGAFVGGTTGALLSAIDAYRNTRGDVRTRATAMMRAAPRGGAILGAFFGGYNLIKYAVEWNVELDEDLAAPAIAAVASLSPLIAIRSLRPSIMYAGALVVMDQLGEQGFI